MSNYNLHRAFRIGCIPLSQLLHFEPHSFGGKTCGDIMINLKVMSKFAWEIITDFDPKTTIFKAGGIYLPKNQQNAGCGRAAPRWGWDFCICFLNEEEKLSVVFFQSKDLTDGNSTTIGPMVIGYSICHTIDQIGHIRRVNGELKFENCYSMCYFPESVHQILVDGQNQSPKNYNRMMYKVMNGLF